MRPFNSFERPFDTRLLKTAAQLFIKMIFGPDKLQAEFFLRTAEGKRALVLSVAY
jgi:hypothetical protein